MNGNSFRKSREETKNNRRVRWPVYIVDSVDSLANLTETLKPRLMRRYSAIEFQLSDKSETENKQLTTEINRLYKTCGCGEGSLVAFIALVGYASYIFTASDISLEWTQLLVGMGYMFIGALIGKLFGMWRGYFQLKRKLRKELSSYKEAYEPSQTEEEKFCAVD